MVPRAAPARPGRSARGRDSRSLRASLSRSRGESTHAAAAAAAAGFAGPLNKERGVGGGARSEPRNCRQVFFLSTGTGKGPAPCPARPALLGGSRVSGEPAEQRRRTVGPCHHFFAC